MLCNLLKINRSISAGVEFILVPHVLKTEGLQIGDYILSVGSSSGLITIVVMAL